MRCSQWLADELIFPTLYPINEMDHSRFIVSHQKEEYISASGFYMKLNVWGSLGLNFEYDGGPIIEIGGPIFLYKLRILEGSTSFREGSV